MLYAAFTVDVDRDVNLQKRGKEEAVSKARKGSDEPRFDSSFQGFKILSSLFQETGIEATFFMEGETAEKLASRCDLPIMLSHHEVAFHGLAHEDLVDPEGILRFDRDAVIERFKKGINKVIRSTGQIPEGFRAPYLHVNDDVLDILLEQNMIYDSSIMMDMVDGRIHPFKTRGIWEIPIACSRDKKGRRIVSYLWPLHEGKRTADDYVEMFNGLTDGLLVLATHSWHLVESYQGVKSPVEVEKNVEDVRRIIEAAKARGIHFTTLSDYVMGLK